MMWNYLHNFASVAGFCVFKLTAVNKSVTLFSAVVTVANSYIF